MEEKEVVFGLFTQIGIGDKEFLYDKGVFRKEEDARKEWDYALNNGCWIEEIKIR